MNEVKIEVNYYEVEEVKECYCCKGQVEINEGGIDIVLGENITFMCDECGDSFLRKMLTELTGINHMN
ncbi:MAG: hypothetical protein ACRDD2_00040 [Sarcina sp.]